jgi:ABC-type nickel/cobalt efflux system permease component RcnA
MRANFYMQLKSLRLVFCIAVMSLLTVAACAHPMGNFSVSHYSKIDLQSQKIVIHYFIDLAEIPAYQELQQASIEAAPNSEIDPSSPAIIRLLANRGAGLGTGLILRLDGNPVMLRLVSSGVIFPPGAGGLPTMKMGFVYEAIYPPNIDRAHLQVDFADNNYQGHSGWKEIIAISSTGRLISSTAPSTDRSKELSNYPTDLLSSPPQTLEASLQASLATVPPTITADNPVAAAHLKEDSRAAVQHAPRSPQPNQPVIANNHSGLPLQARASATGAQKSPGVKNSPNDVPPSVSSSLSLAANQQKTPRNMFTELITQQKLSLWFLFTAGIIAIGLGALHALEPGHGKTIVAAYLVGSRGTARHAVLLGMIVTVSHTAGVFALGAITLYASRYIVPEQLYPWLGVFSGVTIAGLGCYMFLRRWTGTATDHSHVPGSSQAHWPFGRKSQMVTEESGQLLLEEAVAKKVSLTQLFTLGITGGIIPCPAALIVLLSAFALHRIALGFFLIVAFSIGLAAVLIGFGMAMVYARRLMTHLQIDGPLTRRWLPLASSAFITLLGAGVAIQAFTTTQFSFPAFSAQGVGPLLFVAGLGLVLGMRHSTDADHVVAISTIVSKQRSIRNAAMIGSVWGLGHTITIFAVGSLIILFGVEIPPRVGLAMEFCVALMLILLGILNLTGILKRITAYLTPAERKQEGNLIQNAGKLTLRAKIDQSIATFGWYQCIRPLVIGLVHGLAGSAAVALLVLSTIHNPYWATAYLVIFGVGTMIGMMCMTAVIALPLTYAGDRFANLSRYFGVASGMVSLCFGTFLVYQLGFVGGLFTSHPQWTPQ